ncbi:MAG: aldo/keto reductase [Dehalococcoidia bacterium]
MNKRRLGRTGLHIAEVGLGAMDTPHSDEAAETVHAALDAGMDFIDTAREYEGSEFLLGRVIRERGATGFHIGSKTFRHSASGAQYDIDRSLKVLGVPNLTLYQLHDISTPEAFDEVMAEDGAVDGLKAARYRGLIDFIGVSSHNLDVLPRLIESGEFDTVMIEYSAFFPVTAPLMELAAAHDVGVIVMRPVGGSGRTTTMRGNMDRGSAGILTPRNLLRYVLSNQNVSVAIPGARHPSRVVENAATSRNFEPMTPSEKQDLEEAAAALY